jgi:prolyl oligopeptidase family protein
MEVHAAILAAPRSTTFWHDEARRMARRMALTPPRGLDHHPAGGDRTQLTFFPEPVTGALYEPKDGKYFLFLKDRGGDEFRQIFRADLADGSVTLLSDGGRSQNGNIVWSHAGDRIAYGSTRRNGADRDIYVMNPTNRQSDKRLLEVDGGGWGVEDWSPDDERLLASEGISVNALPPRRAQRARLDRLRQDLRQARQRHAARGLGQGRRGAARLDRAERRPRRFAGVDLRRQLRRLHDARRLDALLGPHPRLGGPRGDLQLQHLPRQHRGLPARPAARRVRRRARPRDARLLRAHRAAQQRRQDRQAAVRRTGRHDPRVPKTEAEQIVATVRRGQTPVWYLLGLNEGHGFAKKENSDYLFFAVVEFIKKYVL